MTGGQGRIGRVLVRKLISRGARDIVVLSRSPNPRLFPPQEAQHIRFLPADILDPVGLKRALKGRTVVFHLAGLTRVEDSGGDPNKYLDVNGWGVAQLLDVCHQLNLRRIIYASSALVYGIPRQQPVKETYAAEPRSIYAASKLWGETMLQAYAANFGFSCDIARLSNVYGGKPDPTTVVGSALLQAMSGQGTIQLQNLTNIRDFIHIDDAAEALLRLAAAGRESPGCRTVNVSTSRGVSILDLARTLARIMKARGKALTIRQSGPVKGESQPKLILDNIRLRQITGWSPQISLRQGLSLALDKIR